MIRLNLVFYRIALLVMLCFSAQIALAQNNLDRRISISVKQIKLADFLTEIGKKGNFYFSYSSDLINTDSLITVAVNSKPVRILLDDIFKDAVAYKESPGYVILRPTPNRLKLMPDTSDEPDNMFDISGYVLDDHTGAAVPFASVYEKHLLISTLTDQQGFFKLKFKATGAVTLTVSKEMYKDTSVSFLSKVIVAVKPHNYNYTADTGSTSTERSWLGRLFISSGMKTQAKNIGEFIADVPVQTSFVPGFGTHGLMSSQIINSFSFNVLGGYNAGVAGMELGGLYNLNKQDVKHMQVAGLFNVVGGNVTGVQLGGINNIVYRNVTGVQVGGILNTVVQDVTGVQLAGVLNTVKQNTKGVQVGGVLNKVGQNSSGVQLAGIANISGKTATGLQVAGIFNRAHILKGVHVALINVADTLEGCAINLLSFSRNGYHQFSVYTDDNLITTLAFKTGNASLYTKLIGGYHFGGNEYFAYGFALGHDFELNNELRLSTEFSNQFLQSREWNNMHQLDRFSALLTIPLANKLSVFFGPSLNLYDLGQNNTVKEQAAISKNKLAYTSIGSNFKAWIGWTAGISLF
jgi:hypothetical protein